MPPILPEQFFNSNIVFSSLLCSRLCHELASPLGAVSNGLDLMDEFADQLNEEEKKMIFESQKLLSLRMRFYRLAYGRAGASFDNATEAFTFCRDMLKAKNVNFLEPDIEKITSFPQGWIWLFMNSAMIAGESLLEGGELYLEIEHASPENPCYAFKAEGKNVLIDPVFTQILEHTSNDDIDDSLLTPRNIHAYLSAIIAQALKCGLETKSSKNYFSLVTKNV